MEKSLSTDSPLSTCKVYTLENVEMIHIEEFARITHRSQPSARNLINNGNKIRPLKFFRDRSRLMIPVAELYGYPLTKHGHAGGILEIYHYDDVEMADGTTDIQRVLCRECTEGSFCQRRKEAEELVVPKGDD